MSCRCGCVTNDELQELEQRFLALVAAVGKTEETCPNMRLKPGQTSGPYCRYDCPTCRGLCKVIEDAGASI